MDNVVIEPSAIDSLYLQIQEHMSEHILFKMGQLNSILETSILENGYQIDEVEQYLNQGKRFELNIVREHLSNIWYLYDSYQQRNMILLIEDLSWMSCNEWDYINCKINRYEKYIM